MKGHLRVSNGIKLKSPIGYFSRPTTSRVREAVMNIIRYSLQGSNWLDLFSGSGAMGCEALINGASKVLAIEQNRNNSLICKENLIKTVSSLESKGKYFYVLQKEVLSILRKGSKNIKLEDFGEKKGFDLVYIDPPYEQEHIYKEVLSALITGEWLSKESVVICEHSSEIKLEAESPWIEIDKRLYGQSSLLLISPQ